MGKGGKKKAGRRKPDFPNLQQTNTTTHLSRIAGAIILALTEHCAIMLNNQERSGFNADPLEPG